MTVKHLLDDSSQVQALNFLHVLNILVSKNPNSRIIIAVTARPSPSENLGRNSPGQSTMSSLRFATLFVRTGLFCTILDLLTSLGMSEIDTV